VTDKLDSNFSLRYSSTSRVTCNDSLIGHNRILPVLTILNAPKQDFKGTPLFDVKYISNGTRQEYSCTGILIGIYVLLNDVNSSDREWVSATANFSATQNIARPLCDIWAC